MWTAWIVLESLNPRTSTDAYRLAGPTSLECIDWPEWTMAAACERHKSITKGSPFPSISCLDHLLFQRARTQLETETRTPTFGNSQAWRTALEVTCSTSLIEFGPHKQSHVDGLVTFDREGKKSSHGEDLQACQEPNQLPDKFLCLGGQSIL